MGRTCASFTKPAHRSKPPNWSPDGKSLIYNSKGALWRMPVNGNAKPEQISTGDVTAQTTITSFRPTAEQFISALPGTCTQCPSAAASRGEFPTTRHPNESSNTTSTAFLRRQHLGLRRSGSRRQRSWGLIDLYRFPQRRSDTRLTNTPAPDDGPEYSSDGKWIYFNSELNAKEPGHAQCFRMRLPTAPALNSSLIGHR